MKKLLKTQPPPKNKVFCRCFAGNPYWRGMLSTVGLLVKTACFVRKKMKYCCIKSCWCGLINTRRSIVLILVLQWGFPGFCQSSHPENTNIRNSFLRERLCTVDLFVHISYFMKKKNIFSSIKRSWSELVRTRRSIIQIHSLQWGFLGLVLKLSFEWFQKEPQIVVRCRHRWRVQTFRNETKAQCHKTLYACNLWKLAITRMFIQSNVCK